MGDIDELRSDLEAARAELLASFEGIPQEEFSHRPPEGADAERWAVRDVLWHAGLQEDWRRRVIDEGVNGRAISPFEPRRRPAIANTPEYLHEWLEQCRRPLLALLRRLPDGALDREFALADGDRRTPRALLDELARLDHDAAERVRTLRTLPSADER